MYQMRQPTDVVDKWPYYEYEEYINLLNQRHEEEKKQREKSEGEPCTTKTAFTHSRNATSA